MTEKLNLTLPERKNEKNGSSKGLIILLVLVLIVSAGNLVVSLKGSMGSETQQSGTLATTALKDLALKLEKQGLRLRAADAWQEYLLQTNADNNEQAKIWYRIGKLSQEAHEYERALESFYRSESFAHITELELEISRRTQESLEALGKFSALRYELDQRVNVNPEEGGAGSEVVAEIGTQKITKSELDQKIEEQIKRQLESLVAFLPEEQRNAQQEELFKRFSTASERLKFLNQLVLEEMLYRKAREDKLHEEPSIQSLLKDTERSILAQQYLQQQVTSQIIITPGDLQTYYDANRQDYKEKSLEESKADVYRNLRGQKERELRQRIIEHLRQQNNIVIHTSKFKDESAEMKEAGQPPQAPVQSPVPPPPNVQKSL